MFPADEKTVEEYGRLMSAIKQLSREKREIVQRSSYIQGEKLEKFRQLDTLSKIKKIFDNLKKAVKQRRKKEFNYADLDTAYNDRSVCSYVFEERIAVYTCITGGYDRLLEPLIHPDNIDYYAVTDFELPEDSKWIRIPVERYEALNGYPPALVNRYFKMHPHILFPEYQYSIYVDGSIRIYTDLTEHVNRLSAQGLACFMHSKRKCAYEEAEFCKYLGKETAENIEAYLRRLEEQGLPRNYGVLACGFLVRKHHKKLCVEIMEAWWEEFRDYLKRDQVSLPLVLYKKNLKTEEFATLGGSLHQEYSVEIIPHPKG